MLDWGSGENRCGRVMTMVEDSKDARKGSEERKDDAQRIEKHPCLFSWSPPILLSWLFSNAAFPSYRTFPISHL